MLFKLFSSLYGNSKAALALIAALSLSQPLMAMHGKRSEEESDTKAVVVQPRTPYPDWDIQKDFFLETVCLIPNYFDLLSLSQTCKYCNALLGEPLHNRVFLIGDTG